MAIKEITETMNPAEIDNILVNAMWELAKAQSAKAGAEMSVENAEKQLVTFNEIISYEKAENPAVRSRKQKAEYEARIVTLKEAIEGYDKTISEASAQTNACDAEYNKRGGWTRYWIVTNVNGHIHTTLSCSTCFPTTQYAWLPDLAGSTNSEVVELAGESACTICFPDAPVDTRNRPSRIEEPARRQAREERERKAAEKAEKIRLKAITAPDGGELKIKGHWSSIRTESEAQRLYVNARVSILLHEAGHYVIGNTNYLEEIKENAKTLLPALAHKRGTTEEAERENLEKKALSKIKREWKLTL